MNQSRTALIVDDEAPLLRLIVRVLERAGYTTWAAQDGALALRIFREHASEIDLVLLDVVHPPGAGAVDLLPALLEERSDLDVVLMSGDVLPESLAKILASTNGRFLRKPFAPATLVRMLEPGAGLDPADPPKKADSKKASGIAQARSGNI